MRVSALEGLAELAAGDTVGKLEGDAATERLLAAETLGEETAFCGAERAPCCVVGWVAQLVNNSNPPNSQPIRFRVLVVAPGRGCSRTD